MRGEWRRNCAAAVTSNACVQHMPSTSSNVIWGLLIKTFSVRGACDGGAVNASECSFTAEGKGT